MPFKDSCSAFGYLVLTILMPWVTVRSRARSQRTSSSSPIAVQETLLHSCPEIGPGRPEDFSPLPFGQSGIGFCQRSIHLFDEELHHNVDGLIPAKGLLIAERGGTVLETSGPDPDRVSELDVPQGHIPHLLGSSVDPRAPMMWISSLNPDQALRSLTVSFRVNT